MIRTILLILMLAGMFPAAHAQERSATGQLDTQVTWSAISSHIASTSGKADAVNVRIDQMGVCAKKGMIYAPGASAADGQGCIMPVVPPSIVNTLTTVSNTVNSANTNLSKIITCNTNGQIYNAATGTCKSIVESGMVVKVQASSQPIAGNGKYASYALASCPTGTSLIDCAGARNPSITDTCDEDKCGYIGSGPINDNTCMTTVDDDTGTRATVWAFCLKTNQ